MKVLIKRTYIVSIEYLSVVNVLKIALMVKDKMVVGSNYCIACSISNCKRCTVSSCKKCIDSYYIQNSNNTCVSNCHQFADGTC